MYCDYATNRQFYYKMISFTCIVEDVDLDLRTCNFQNISWWLLLNNTVTAPDVFNLGENLESFKMCGYIVFHC